jgi:uncharacterized protein (TIGR03437 family)
MRCLCAVFIAWIAQAAGLVFEPNVGQTNPNIRFFARTREWSIAISASEIAIRAGSAQVHLQFVDSEPMVLEGLDRQPGVVNHLLGSDPKQWLRRIPTYARITSRNLYPGVDVLFHGTGSGLEYDFELAPGADASRIGLKFTGAQSVRVDEQGDLVIDTAAGELRQKKPLIYQESDGHRQVIDGRYRLIGDGQVAVDIASYDRRRSLVIDPELVYAVRVGGSGSDQVNAIATDSQGNTYITGQTSSLNFPVKNAFESQPKLSNLYRSDAGGPLMELQSVAAPVNAIAVEPSNSAVAYFGTAQGLFKTTDAGAHATLLAGGLPAGANIGPIAVDPSNVSTAYVAGYIPSGGYGLAVYKTTDGGADWAAINNGLNGPQGLFAITQLYVDPTQPSHLFAQNTFAEAFRSTDSGATWVASGFSYDCLTFDPSHSGTVYAANTETGTANSAVYKSTDGGNTWTMLGSPIAASANAHYVASLAVDPFHPGTLWAGTSDGVYKSTNGGQTWSSTSLEMQPSEVAADPVVSNTIYALTTNGLYKTADAGTTWAAIGPASLTTFALASDERMYAGGNSSIEAFVTKLDPTGNFVYSTYIGGSVNDQATGIAVDRLGNAYVTGTTSSPDFPTTAGATNAAATGAFVLRLNPAGDTLGYSVIVADQDTQPAGIALDPAGNAYITGSTNGDLPVTPGAYFSTPPAGEPTLFFYLYGSDAFVLKLNASGALSYATYANEARVGGMFGVLPIASAIAVDASGNAYITGSYFLLKFNASASGLVYSAPSDPWGAGGYVGNAIVLDAQDNAYVAGRSDYGHAYVSKFDANGHAIFNTGNSLLAGEGTDTAQGVAVDSAGNIFVAGYTTSVGFPLRSPVQEAFSLESGFLTELDSSANLLFSTYVGDTSFFQVSGLALDPTGKPVFCGNAYINQTFVDGAEIYYVAGVTTNPYVAKYDTSGVPAVRLDALNNLASQLPVPVSPGELVAIKGAGFAADAQLFFNDVAATMIAGSGSSAPMAIVPSALSGLASALAHVESGGQSSNAVLVPIAAAAPGIFTVSGTGMGQALAFNQDGTPNSQAHPAPVGSMVTFYATGVGQTGLATNAYIVYIGYGDADNLIAASPVQFSVAPAPGFPADVLKVQATVPVGIYSPGAVPVEIVENGVACQAGVIIWISL